MTPPGREMIHQAPQIPLPFLFQALMTGLDKTVNQDTLQLTLTAYDLTLHNAALFITQTDVYPTLNSLPPDASDEFREAAINLQMRRRNFANATLTWANELLEQPNSRLDDTQSVKLIENALLIGQSANLVASHNEAYPRILLQAADRAIWGAFETERELIQEILKLVKLPDEAYALLNRRNTVFPKLLQTEEGLKAAKAYLGRETYQGRLDWILSKTPTEQERIKTLYTIAQSSPELLLALSMTVLDRAIFVYSQSSAQRICPFTDSTIGALIQNLTTIWKISSAQDFVLQETKGQEYSTRLAHIEEWLNEVQEESVQSAVSKLLQRIQEKFIQEEQ